MSVAASSRSVESGDPDLQLRGYATVSSPRRPVSLPVPSAELRRLIGNGTSTAHSHFPTLIRNIEIRLLRGLLLVSVPWNRIGLDDQREPHQ
jgi:hypothetical protein